MSQSMTAGGPPLPPPQAPGPWDGGQPYLPPPPVYPVATYYPGPQQGPAPGIGYAGFWIRVVAAIIDGIIFGVPYLILFFVVEGSAISHYATCLNNAVANGTLGQRMLGLHVVDAATGQNIGIGRAIGRFIGYVISALALDIGLIWVAFDPRKQGWHDKIASTFVVRKV